MIRPGRRRREAPPTLAWHRRLASERRRAVRARRAAWGALVAIVPALILFAWVDGVVWALPVAALAAIVAASLPVRDADRWARRWLTSERGLGYETSLEADGRDDPFGFWRRAREATLSDLRDAPRPAPTRWWLPPAIATLLLIVAVPFLPSTGFRAGLGDVRSTDASTAGRTERESSVDPGGPSGDPSGSDEVAGAVPEARDSGDLPNAAPAPEERDEASDEPTDQPSQGDAGRSSSEGAGGSPVDRFLRDLDTAEEEGTNPFEPVQDSSPRGGEGATDRDAADLGPREPSSSGARDAVDGAEPSDRAGEGSDGRPGGADDASEQGERGVDAGDEGDAGEGDSGEGGAETASSRGSGNEGDDGDDGNAESARAESGSAGDDSDGDDARDAAGRGDGESPEAGGLTDGDDADAGGAGGGASPDERSGSEERSSGASAAGGNASPVEPMLGAPDGPARRLAGEREDGEVPTVGSVRGAGAPPDAVPEGRGVTAAEARSAERTSEEQGLPGAYREIIRRYFR